MRKTMLMATALLAAGFGTMTMGNAFAAGNGTIHDRAEAEALLGAKMSALDAAAAAAKVVPGKVAEIGFDAEKSGVTYEITIIASDGSEHNLLVDASNGNVARMAADHDNEGGQDEDREEDDRD